MATLVVIGFVGWPIYRKFATRPVSASLFKRTKAAVEKNPNLQADWNKAMEDGILTWPTTQTPGHAFDRFQGPGKIDVSLFCLGGSGGLT
jgi:hypothetical protein